MGHFLNWSSMWEIPAHCGQCLPELVVLSSIRNQVEQTVEIKSVNSVSPWLLLQFLPPDPCPAFFNDRLPQWFGGVSWNKHLSPQIPFSLYFIIATEKQMNIFFWWKNFTKYSNLLFWAKDHSCLSQVPLGREATLTAITSFHLQALILEGGFGGLQVPGPQAIQFSPVVLYPFPHISSFNLSPHSNSSTWPLDAVFLFSRQCQWVLCSLGRSCSSLLWCQLHSDAALIPCYFHIRLNTDKGLAVRFAWLCLLSFIVKVVMIQQWILMH